MFPEYIQKTKASEAPLDFAWKGTLAHIGPIEGTAVHTALVKPTMCAAVGVAVASELWAVYRLQHHIDREQYLNRIAAHRAWMVHPLYRSEGRADTPESPPAVAAMAQLGSMMRRVCSDSDWKGPDMNPNAVPHVLHLTRHLMPKDARKPFEAWMKWALSRALETSPRPDAPLPAWDSFETREAYFDAGRPYFGRPLPLEAFDPDFDYRPERDAELLDAFLRSLDHTKNPFLRSPDAMKTAGFTGTPYRYG